MLGVIIVILGLVVETNLLIAGTYLLVTGFLRWCPLYLPFKLMSY